MSTTAPAPLCLERSLQPQAPRPQYLRMGSNSAGCSRPCCCSQAAARWWRRRAPDVPTGVSATSASRRLPCSSWRSAQGSRLAELREDLTKARGLSCERASRHGQALAADDAHTKSEVRVLMWGAAAWHMRREVLRRAEGTLIRIARLCLHLFAPSLKVAGIVLRLLLPSTTGHLRRPPHCQCLDAWPNYVIPQADDSCSIASTSCAGEHPRHPRVAST